MADDPRAAIREILDDDGDPLAALRILRYAIEWSAATVSSALTDRSTRPGDDIATLELVIAVDDALEAAEDLAVVTPQLAQHALAGVAVAEHLERQTAALARASQATTVARHDREALAAVEAELKAEAAEHERLTGAITEWDRLRELSAALPAIREQHDRLQHRREAILDETAAAEHELMETAETVVLLRAETVARLSDRTRAALHELEVAESGWAALARQHAQASEKTEQLRHAHEARTAELLAHADIDRDLIGRLIQAADSPVFDKEHQLALTRIRDNLVGEVHHQLDRAELLLNQVDRGLAAALRRYEEIGAAERHELDGTGGRRRRDEGD